MVVYQVEPSGDIWKSALEEDTVIVPGVRPDPDTLYVSADEVVNSVTGPKAAVVAGATVNPWPVPVSDTVGTDRYVPSEPPVNVIVPGKLPKAVGEKRV